MPHKHYMGLPCAIHRGTLKVHEPSPPKFSKDQLQIIERKLHQLLDNVTVIEVQYHPRGWVSLHLIPGTGGQRPFINLKVLNFCIKTHYFKMEGYTSQGSTATWRLVDKCRPEGCVFHDPYMPGSLEVHPILSPRQGLPVHMPPIQFFFRTMGLH